MRKTIPASKRDWLPCWGKFDPDDRECTEDCPESADCKALAAGDANPATEANEQDAKKSAYDVAFEVAWDAEQAARRAGDKVMAARKAAYEADPTYQAAKTAREAAWTVVEKAADAAVQAARLEEVQAAAGRLAIWEKLADVAAWQKRAEAAADETYKNCDPDYSEAEKAHLAHADGLSTYKRARWAAYEANPETVISWKRAVGMGENVFYL